MVKPGYLDFRIDPSERALLEHHAARTGYSVSEIARRCLRMGLRFADDFEPKPSEHAVRLRKPAAVPA